MENKYSIKVEDNCIKLYINDLIHVAIKKPDFVGYTSWIIGFQEPTRKYCIEFITKDQDILTEYNDIKKWKTILKLLDRETPSIFDKNNI